MTSGRESTTTDGSPASRKAGAKNMPEEYGSTITAGRAASAAAGGIPGGRSGAMEGVLLRQAGRGLAEAGPGVLDGGAQRAGPHRGVHQPLLHHQVDGG